jgi:hypothetical protein
LVKIDGCRDYFAGWRIAFFKIDRWPKVSIEDMMVGRACGEVIRLQKSSCGSEQPLALCVVLQTNQRLEEDTYI